MSGTLSDRLARIAQLYGRAVAAADPLRVGLWHERELTTQQLRALLCLRSGEGASLGELAAALGVSLPNMSGLVDRLVRQGLVRRCEDESDRRVVRHHLTPEGHALVGEIARSGRAWIERVLGHLTAEELDAVERGLALFVRAAEQETQRDEPAITARE
jgi:DNA-binding MarR family transcriptional regulator